MYVARHKFAIERLPEVNDISPAHLVSTTHSLRVSNRGILGCAIRLPVEYRSRLPRDTERNLSGKGALCCYFVPL